MKGVKVTNGGFIAEIIDGKNEGRIVYVDEQYWLLDEGRSISTIIDLMGDGIQLVDNTRDAEGFISTSRLRLID